MTSFWQWWQQLPHHIDPVLISLGGFEIRYYGLMYLVAFGVAWWIMRYRIRHDEVDISMSQVNDYMFWSILAVLVGGRLGYVLFYDLGYYLSHPLAVILPFSTEQGLHFTGFRGMSFHGGALAVALVTIVFCRKRGIRITEFGDLLVSAVPLAYTFGRLGNFINGELYGRVTHLPWGMSFPEAPGAALRHPSQLYEAFFEGIVLFILIWWLRGRVQRPGRLLGIYLVGYSAFRFGIEFVREPDAHLGFVAGALTMGQVLCLVMGAAGLILLLWNRKSNRKPPKSA